MKILVKREYHGQIWFEAEDVDALWKTSKSFQWSSRRNFIRDGCEATHPTNTEGNRSVNDSPVQSHS